MCHKLWEGRVTALTEAADGLFRLAQPSPKGDKAKAQIARAARAAGLPYGRAWSIWYGKARRIDPHELDAIRAAQRTRQEKQDDLAQIADDFAALADRAAKVLASRDRAMADAMRAVAVRAGRLALGKG